MKDKKLLPYLLWAFALAWPLQLLASHFALRGSLSLFRILLAVVMFAPLLAAVLAGISLKDMGWRPELGKNLTWFLVSWLGPAALAVLGGALFFLVFPSRLDLSGSIILAQVEALGGKEAAEALQTQGLPMPLLLLLQVVQSVTYAPFLNMALALGEEVGWRGAMTPRLKERFGPRGGRLLAGVIWGVWHWPVIVLAGYEYGLDYWGAPFVGPLLFCLFTVTLGILLDLVYEKTRCIWYPALAHGAVNAAAGIPTLFLAPAFADRLLLGPAMHGLLAGLPLLLSAAAVLAAKPRKGGEI